MDEIWKDIVGFEGLYQISNLGRVRSLDRFLTNRIYKGKVLKPSLKKGYPFVVLAYKKKFKTFEIHRLVGLHFIPNPNNLRYLNHKNGIKNDYSIENLEWCTLKHNSNHAYETGLMPIGEDHHYSKLKEQQVIEIKIALKNGISRKDLSKKYNISTNMIHLIDNEKNWKHI